MMRWLRARFGCERAGVEIERELRFHLDQQISDGLAAGLSREEAERQARLALGGLQQVKEACRDVHRLAWLDDFGRVFRFAFRSLRKSPGFASIVILTLALGIGANAAIFSVIDGVFLRPLPYPHAERLVYAVQVWQHETDDAVGTADFLYWKDHNRAFDDVGAYSPSSGLNLSAGDIVRFVPATRVSVGLFRTLSVEPVVGRDFRPEESRADAPPAVIISHRLWESAFHGDTAIAGRQVTLDGESRTIVGVMPADFQFVTAADVYTPMQLVMHPRDHDQNYSVVARLRPGVTLAEAQADSARVFGEFAEEYPAGVPPGWQGVRWIPYQQELAGSGRAPLFALLGAVLFLLFIAVANVANLCIGRSAARRSEVAVRVALGAGRWHLLRQLLAEGLLLALIGGALALLVAHGILAGLKAIVPATGHIDVSTTLVPLAAQVQLNGRVFTATLAIALAAGLIASLAPWWSVQRSVAAIDTSLHAGNRRASRDSHHHRLRSILVITQVAVSLVLLSGASLLAVSFVRLRTVDPGFNPSPIWTLQVSLPPKEYPTTHDLWRMEERITTRLTALPGVAGAAVTSNLPVERGLNFSRNIPGCGQVSRLQLRAVGPDYFSVLGVPLLRGRAFVDADQPTSAPVAVINAALAHLCWPTGRAIGTAVTIGAPPGSARQIVGVVGNTAERGLDQSDPPTIFIPQAQASDALMQVVRGWFLPGWVMRTSRPLSAATVQRAVRDAVPDVPIANLRPMTAVINDSFAVAQSRLLGLLVGGFSLLALLVAAIGIYGLIAFSVTERTHEIGIRLALGARRSSVLGLVVGSGLRLTMVGLAIGVGGALLLMRAIATLLYGTTPTDPLAIAGVCAIWLAVAALASYIPARRAARVDPLDSLKAE